MKKILIIEDDREIAALERDYLEANGFEVEIDTWGTTGLDRALNGDHSLFIVDIMLPGMDGFEIVRRIREKKQTPVIILSAKGDDIDKIRGLGLGADDYMTKPFSPAELVARVKARLSRFDALTSPPEKTINIRSLSISPESRTAKINGSEIMLTAKEFDLLLFLASYPNRTFSKEQLFDHVWGLDALGDVSTVAVHIQRIREKLSISGDTFIHTVWSVGYKLA